MQAPSSTPPPQATLAPLLGVLSQLFQSRMAALLGPQGLSYTQLVHLAHLERAGDGQSISDLARALEIQQPGVTKVVRRLGEEGLVSTSASTRDPRRKEVSLTDAGRQRLRHVEAALAADVEAWFEGWSEDELGAFAGSVGRLVAWFDAHRP